MTRDMNTIYGQNICNYGTEKLRCCGDAFFHFLRFAAVLLLMVVGVSGVKAQVTLTTDESHPNYYLIQSYVNTAFYMRPNGTNVNTLNILNDNMKWFFLDAGKDNEGTENEKQCYYICRKNETETQYMYFSSPNYVGTNADQRIWILLKTLESGSEDNYKFFIEPNSTTGAYNIIPKGTTNNSSLNKQGGNAGNGNVQVGSGTADEGSNWYFIAVNDFEWNPLPQCFTVSPDDDNKVYYKIKSQQNPAYFIKPGDSYVQTSSSTSDEDEYAKMMWYFKEAESNGLMPYYYIVHAATGKYLRHRANGDNATELTDHLGTETGDAEKRFQFIVVRGANNKETHSNPDGSVSGSSKLGIVFNIVPKMLENSNANSLNSLTTTGTMGKGLKTENDRFNTKTHWTFEPVWGDPVVTCDENGTITITGEDGAEFYYTMNNSTTPPATPTATESATNFKYYSSSKPTAGTGFNTIKVRAIGGEKSDSRVITQKIVYVPNQTFESTYDGTAQTPVVKVGETTISSDEYNISYKLGGTDVTECKNSGTYTVTITDKDGGEYIVYGSGSFTINPASVTLTANSKNTDVYDGTEKTVTGFTCKKGEQTIEGLTFTGVSASGKGTNAGTYDVTFTGVTLNTTKDATGNYVVTETTNGTLTINRKDVTITAKSKSKMYDGTALTESGFEATALETGDTHSFTVVMTDGSTITNAGTQPNVIAKVDGFAVTTGNATDVGNYKVTTANGTLTISKKDVTISGITAKNKVYDGNTTATLVYTGVIFTGKLDGENLTVSATGTFADKTAGTGKTVTISGLTLGGSGAGNYAPAASGQQETTTADITVKEVTATGTITAKNKEYDGKTTAVLDYTGVTLTGKVEGDDLNVSATGTFADKNIGTGKTVNISEWVLAGTDKDNYRMASLGQPTTTTADITVANITVSGITAKNKVYDGTTTAELDYTNVTLTGKVEGESLTVTATGAFVDKNVGTDKTVNITGLTLGGTDKNNYQLASTGQQTTAKANITAKEITISGITASNKEYDGNTTATLVYTGVTYTGKLDGENLTVTATGAFADKNVGTDKTVNITGLTLGDADASNYTLPTTGQQETTKANITAAPVTVTAENKTKGYGDSDPTFTWTVTGLKGSDTKDVLTVTISRETGEDVRVTPYTITPAGEPTQGNYTIIYATGTLTITAKAIGDGTNPAVGIDIDVTYDGTNYTVTVKQGDNTLATTNYIWSGAEDQDHPENYVVTVSGQGNYNNSAKATYTKLTFWDTTPDQTLTSETTAAVYCATQNLKVNESFEAYYVTNLADNTLTLTKVEAGESKKNYIPVNQPMILISDAASAPKGFTVKPYTDTEVITIPDTGEGSNLLKVVTDAGGLAVNLAQVYMFSQGEFVLTKAGTMSKGKFYLENPNYNTPAPSRSSLRIVSDDTTGIATSSYRDIDSEIIDTWYTIGGQKLNKKPTRKGLYLQNGKKVVIK